MWNRAWADAGTAALIKRSRDRYNANPPRCLFCGQIIPVLEGQRICEVMKKKFCNQSCSAKYYNAKRVISNGSCEGCGLNIINHTTGKYKRKYCDVCRKDIFKGNAIKVATDRHGELINPDSCTKSTLMEKYGKSELYRSVITRHARTVFNNSGKPKICPCGYDKHIDVCHIRGIADFPNSSTISEINSLDNLMGLCKNHHWEFDHGILDDEMQKKIGV